MRDQNQTPEQIAADIAAANAQAERLRAALGGLTIRSVVESGTDSRDGLLGLATVKIGECDDGFATFRGRVGLTVDFLKDCADANLADSVSLHLFEAISRDAAMFALSGESLNGPGILAQAGHVIDFEGKSVNHDGFAIAEMMQAAIPGDFPEGANPHDYHMLTHYNVVADICEGAKVVAAEMLEQHDIDLADAVARPGFDTTITSIGVWPSDDDNDTSSALLCRPESIRITFGDKPLNLAVKPLASDGVVEMEFVVYLAATLDEPERAVLVKNINIG